METKNFFKKLNKLTKVKIAVIIAIIVAIEAVCGFIIYNTYHNYIYELTYNEYQSTIDRVADDLGSDLGDNISQLEVDVSVYNNLTNYLSGNDSFANYIIFTEASGGRIVGEDWFLKQNLKDYDINYNTVEIINIDNIDYVFFNHKIANSSYYVGALVDFTEQNAIISGMLDNLVAMLIVACVLVVGVFLFYAFWAGSRNKEGKFDYKFLVTSDGKIEKASHKFKQDFPDCTSIKANLLELNDKYYNIFKLTGTSGEKMMVARLKPVNGECVKVNASIIDNPSAIVDFDGDELTVNGKAKASLKKTYEEFSKRGKRTFIGILNITNLNAISVLFGKEMALDIHKIVMKKAKEKFVNVYELDLGMIGMVYPDGKKLDILQKDLSDYINYISQPIHMDDNLFTVSLKCGFALCDGAMKDRSFEYAMRAAEGARQRAIDTNVADFIVYDESQKKLYTKYFITYNIKQMLEEGAFEMEYQPQYNINDNRIEGFEALFRVKKSWNVNVDTYSFIAYAERTGAMVQLGDFIFDTGMRFAKKLEGRNVSVSLNVSPVQLLQNGFTENFLAIYRKYDLKPGSICVEITESFLMANFQDTFKKLEILRKNGINVHLDDFGTEYSSLLYLKNLPISTIKIDRGFLKDITIDNESQAVIRFITNIAKLLNLSTICEGVETAEEFDMVKALGCDNIQGWYIGKSMKPEDAIRLIDEYDNKLLNNMKIAG